MSETERMLKLIDEMLKDAVGVHWLNPQRSIAFVDAARRVVDSLIDAEKNERTRAKPTSLRSVVGNGT